MIGVRMTRLLAAAGTMALMGACADQPMPLAPNSWGIVATRASSAVAGQGELQLCKTGNSAGTFTFDYSIVTQTGGNPIASGSVSVDAGQCASLLQLPTSGSDRVVARITETNIPANWALNSIVATNTTATPAGFPAPIVDVGAATVSNVGVRNDVGATVTFDNQYTAPPPPPAGCTYTQGYWKTHSLAGPAPYDNTWATLPQGSNTTFYNSGDTWLGVFNTPPAGNAYYQLAVQFMAATLNGYAGANQGAVSGAMASATTLFNNYTPAQVAALAKKSAVRAQFLSLAGTLDNYNNGITGPGHCGT